MELMALNPFDPAFLEVREEARAMLVSKLPSSERFRTETWLRLGDHVPESTRRKFSGSDMASRTSSKTIGQHDRQVARVEWH